MAARYKKIQNTKYTKKYKLYTDNNWRESTLLRVQIPAKAKFAPTGVPNSLLSYYLFIIAKLFKVKDGYLKFVYIGKIAGLRRFWTVKSTPG